MAFEVITYCIELSQELSAKSIGDDPSELLVQSDHGLYANLMIHGLIVHLIHLMIFLNRLSHVIIIRMGTP